MPTGSQCRPSRSHLLDASLDGLSRCRNRFDDPPSEVIAARCRNGVLEEKVAHEWIEWPPRIYAGRSAVAGLNDLPAPLAVGADSLGPSGRLVENLKEFNWRRLENPVDRDVRLELLSRSNLHSDRTQTVKALLDERCIRLERSR